mmetsp:Transcript_10007/g.15168  ORF Transcript_10007/g.15168 Transcript_10007/m.15168 type:complete len:395 (-) Transcript_10007:1223-2407(-)
MAVVALLRDRSLLYGSLSGRSVGLLAVRSVGGLRIILAGFSLVFHQVEWLGLVALQDVRIFNIGLPCLLVAYQFSRQLDLFLLGLVINGLGISFVHLMRLVQLVSVRVRGVVILRVDEGSGVVMLDRLLEVVLVLLRTLSPRTLKVSFGVRVDRVMLRLVHFGSHQGLLVILGLPLLFVFLQVHMDTIGSRGLLGADEPFLGLLCSSGVRRQATHIFMREGPGSQWLLSVTILERIVEVGEMPSVVVSRVDRAQHHLASRASSGRAIVCERSQALHLERLVDGIGPVLRAVRTVPRLRGDDHCFFSLRLLLPLGSLRHGDSLLILGERLGVLTGLGPEVPVNSLVLLVLLLLLLLLLRGSRRGNGVDLVDIEASAHCFNLHLLGLVHGLEHSVR